MNIKAFFIVSLFFVSNFFFAQKDKIIITMQQETSNNINLDFGYLKTNFRSLDWAPILKKRIIKCYSILLIPEINLL